MPYLTTSAEDLSALCHLNWLLVVSGKYHILVIPLLLSLSSQELSLSVPDFGYTSAD